jgi:hypothetical protein
VRLDGSSNRCGRDGEEKYSVLAGNRVPIVQLEGWIYTDRIRVRSSHE